MIAWALWSVAFGLLVMGATRLLARALWLVGHPTRWAWAAALLMSFIAPFSVFISDTDGAAPVELQAAAVGGEGVAAPPPAPSPVATPSLWVDAWRVVERGGARVAAALEPADRPFRIVWGASLVLLPLWFAAGALRLRAARRRWAEAVVDGLPVLRSAAVGPALVGVHRPAIVLPDWALALPAPMRALVLAHEREHLRAGDGRLLALALVPLWLTPWNAALWWGWRRLRDAVEQDCDARVLRGGAPVAEYAELLLAVGARARTSLPLASALALGEPATQLERRIRTMTDRRPPLARPRALLLGGGALLVVGAACMGPRPDAVAGPGAAAPRAEIAVTEPGAAAPRPRMPRGRFDTMRDAQVIRAALADRLGVTPTSGSSELLSVMLVRDSASGRILEVERVPGVRTRAAEVTGENAAGSSVRIRSAAPAPRSVPVSEIASVEVFKVAAGVLAPGPADVIVVTRGAPRTRAESPVGGRAPARDAGAAGGTGATAAPAQGSDALQATIRAAVATHYPDRGAGARGEVLWFLVSPGGEVRATFALPESPEMFAEAVRRDPRFDTGRIAALHVIRETRDEDPTRRTKVIWAVAKE